MERARSARQQGRNSASMAPIVRGFAPCFRRRWIFRQERRVKRLAETLVGERTPGWRTTSSAARRRTCVTLETAVAHTDYARHAAVVFHLVNRRVR